MMPAFAFSSRPKLLLAATAAAGLLAATAIVAAGEPSWSERTVVAPMDFEAALQLSKTDLAALIDKGERLFRAKFTPEEGAGRPKATQAIVPTKRKRGENAAFQRTGGPDAGACASCHNEPVVGGAGDFVANVFVSEGFESADFDSIDPQFSNERNTNHLMGAGLVELLAREMTADLAALRNQAVEQARAAGADATVKLVSKGVEFGQVTAKPDGILDVSRIEGIDTDLVVRPFSQKGVFVSLRQFSVNAMNHHHGMQAVERFGGRWTGTPDFDEDGKADEMGDGDISAITLWQARLPAPGVKRGLAEDWRQAAARGEALFSGLGCAACHKPSLPLSSLVFADPGPYDMAGTLNARDVKEPIRVDLGKTDWGGRLKRNERGEWLVPLFGDLKRHAIVDEGATALGNEIMGQRFVERDVFMTAELWGIGSTAPYGHRGDFTTLDGIILAHGGEARAARDAYARAGEEQRASIIAFLRSLVIE
jgi:cytochrome c peroxidase